MSNAESWVGCEAISRWLRQILLLVVVGTPYLHLICENTID